MLCGDAAASHWPKASSSSPTASALSGIPSAYSRARRSPTPSCPERGALLTAAGFPRSADGLAGPGAPAPPNHLLLTEVGTSPSPKDLTDGKNMFGSSDQRSAWTTFLLWGITRSGAVICGAHPA